MSVDQTHLNHELNESDKNDQYLNELHFIRPTTYTD